MRKAIGPGNAQTAMRGAEIFDKKWGILVSSSNFGLPS